MNNEIKKLLEDLKFNIPIEEYRSEATSDGLTHYEEDKDSWQYRLLDYITNLQKENEELKSKNDILEFRMKQNDKMVICERYRILKQRDDYKSRCEKAVDEIQQLIDDVNNKTIIGLNNFLSKLEEIQDKLANGGDEE